MWTTIKTEYKITSNVKKKTKITIYCNKISYVNVKHVIENSIQHLLINILKFVKKYFLIKENRSPVKSKGA
jgi:hypothetical protein